MAFIDYYKILGVDRNIPQKDVRAAYRKRAKLFHPDLHPNDPKAKAKFQALNEAYDVISDPEKRAKYDKYGEQWRQADAFQGNDTEGFSGGNPFEGFDFSGYGSGGGGFSSFFQDLFGGEVLIQLSNGQKIKLKVKPETQNGTKVRVRGRGYSRGNGTYGDLIIVYNVKLPTGLSERQKQLLQEMRNS